MTDALLLMIALSLLALAGVLWRRGALAAHESTASSRVEVVSAPSCQPSPTPSSSSSTLPQGSAQAWAGSEPGWLRVQDALTLLTSVGALTSLPHMLRQSRLAPATWERDLLPAIHRYAEFVQLMPASESHHHAHAGGLLSHTLEMLLAAMMWRNGCLLPQGATAEDLDAHRDHWTYAVFFAALLHDIGKPMVDLRVSWRHAGRSDLMRWTPIAGSLVDCKAQEYLVKFAPSSERDYSAHSKVGMQLLQRIAPASSLRFLASHPPVLDALTQYLSGEGRDNDLGRLVRKADQASTRRALAIGSRARFETAQKEPLIDVLMAALRSMLQRGGELPLNRDGAAGWVSGDSVYFVAKRLADSVRAHVRERWPEESIPAEDRNDRLFDTWQEYGFLMVNPLTQQAIWRVTVHGEDGEGYAHSLSVLRFPLAKLWGSPEHYPAAMQGRIEVLGRGKGGEAGAGGDQLLQPGAEAKRAKTGAAGDAATTAKSSAPTEGGKPAVKLVRAPKLVAGNGAAAGAIVVRDVRSAAPMGEAGSREERPTASERLQDMAAGADVPEAKPPVADAPAMASPRYLGNRDEDEDWLDAEDDAGTEARRRAGLNVRTARAAPIGVGRAVPDSVPPIRMPPLAPPLPGAGGGEGARAAKEPTAVAVAFLTWLQAGLASGELRYNAAGAPVHFVPQGMALVSPLIFRLFAQSQEGQEAASAPGETVDAAAAEQFGLDVQREVLRAGWHLPADDGMNIHCFAVRKRGKSRSGKLSAVVIAGPERLVTPVPPANPALRDWAAAQAEEAADA